MAKDIPLKIETISPENDEKHNISSPKEIRFVMQYISEKGNRVALYYDDNSSFILTTLLSVDDTGMWLEQSPNDSENRKILGSNRLTFVSSHLQIKVQFNAKQASNDLYQGIPAFYLPLPLTLYRFQRREYFRLSTPINSPLYCEILTEPTMEITTEPTIDPTMEPAVISTEKKLHKFIVMDISCGGVGLVCLETDTILTPGKSYSNCKIELPELGAIRGAIEVKNQVILTSNSGKEHRRAGCEFKDLDGPSMILLQRYITNMQRTKVTI
jgi:c-di-GMP-binding flagellar brake protein YcgR